MPGTAPVLGTSAESQVTLVGALSLSPVKEGKEKYRMWMAKIQGEEAEEGER